MKRILTTMILTAAAGLAQTPATDAIAALRGINAATEIGTNVREYRTRVIDAKVKVDAYVNAAAKDDAQAKAVAATMRMYVLAAKAWGGGADYATFLEVGKAVMEEAGIADTPGLAAAWPKWLNGKEKTDEDRYASIGALMSIKPGLLWRYAAVKLETLKQ